MQLELERLLIVSDDELIVELIGVIFSKHSNYQLTHILIDDFARNSSVENDISVVLIDERKNIDKLLKINRLVKKRHPQLPIIVLSDYLDREFDLEFTSSGADYVIPINNIHYELPAVCMAME